MTLLITFFLSSIGFAQTFLFTADSLALTGEPGTLITFHAAFESLIDDTQWVNFHVDTYDFPDENWTFSVCNDSGCFPPGFNDMDNLYQPFESDTLITFDIHTTEIGDSGHFSATLTAVRDPETPQTIHFTVYNHRSGVEVRDRWIPEISSIVTAHPNPFNSETVLQFSVIHAGQVELTIYDLLGRKVTQLLSSERLSPGSYKIRWNGSNDSGISMPSGAYFATLKSNDKLGSCRIYLLR